MRPCRRARADAAQRPRPPAAADRRGRRLRELRAAPERAAGARSGAPRTVVRRADVVIARLGDGPVERVGGKAAGLARLLELGLPVPPAFVLPVGFELTDAAAIVAELGEPLAVRSSAVGEDAGDRSAAGQ